MEICHDHNLARETRREPRNYGIRLSLPANDPLIPLLGEDWEKIHWYETPEERDRALKEMTKQHLYYRKGDKPSFVYEKLDR